MKFTQYHSSSSGNLYTVTANNGQILLIECGVRWKEIVRSLNHDLSNISGCLLSHEHADHSKGVKDLITAGIDVYGSEGTLFLCLNDTNYRRAFILGGGYTKIGCFEVIPFDVHHDAQEPLGFIIKADGESLLFATDTSHLIYKFRTKFDIVALECSYNRGYLQKRMDEGKIHPSVAERLLLSHMEEKEALRTLSNFIDLSKCREVHLLHCSADNINKDRIKAEFEKKLFVEVKIL